MVQISRYTTWGGTVEPDFVDVVNSAQKFESGPIGYSFVCQVTDFSS